ncbi:MAG: CPXCG motif-containing cysteine-rich protein [Bacteroidota bacterium]|nr:CPXCG motif-containing cysteine-rich protein [Bacteroidota bacterium]
MSEDIEFNCPYCGELNFTNIFFSDGKSQNFIYDCEVCCKPMEISVTKDADGNIFIDAKNDEGF